MMNLKDQYQIWKNNLTKEEWIDYVQSKKGPTEQWQDAWTEVARDKVHNLDLSISEHREIYKNILKTHIMFGELEWDFENVESKHFDCVDSNKYKTFQVPIKPIINKHAYEDNKDLKTVGIGFNMDRPEAKNEWEKILGNKISFDDVYNEKIDITDEQADKLFDYSLQIREQELRKKFGSDWNILKPNEKITIMSLYYNHPALVGPKFKYNIKKYIETNDPKYLKQAFFEVKHQSNPRIDKKGKKISIVTRTAVQNRMDKESAMIESYKCPLYSKPNNSAIPNKQSMKIIPGKTIIPRVGKLQIDTEEFDKDGNKKQYYIWRSKGDDKVRLTHREFEDKIFHIDHPPTTGHPGKDHKCRCVKDFNIPDFVQFENYDGQLIRKQITNLLDIPEFCIK